MRERASFRMVVLACGVASGFGVGCGGSLSGPSGGGTAPPPAGADAGAGSKTSGSGGATGSGSGGFSSGSPNPGSGGLNGTARPPGSGGSATGGSSGTGSGGASSSSGGAPGSAGSAPGTGGSAGNSGDIYVPVGTNPFIATRHDPFSTFAADVDTASYDIFRRDITLGALPQPASVRLEEYVNYFKYAYPAPAATDEIPFKISLGAARDVFERHTTLLRVGIQAADPPAFVKRPANVVFLIDCSGSMADPNKLPLVQRLVIDALEVLEPTDKVSIVTYAQTALVRLPPTPASQRAAITAVVNGLVASGGTAGADALGLAYAQAQAGHIEGGINHIILSTDGDFNIGPSSTAELLNLVRSKRLTGVTLTTLGFGVGNLNDQMMEAVSDAGNGMYSVISSAELADRYASERLLRTMTHVAKDMKIQVEFNPAKVLAYRLLGYEDRAIADTDFRNDRVDAGEVGAGHRVTALYELVLAGQSLALKPGQPAILDGIASDLPAEISPQDLVLVKVRHKPVTATDATPASEVAVSLSPSELRDTVADCDPDLRWAAAVAAFSEILKNSPFADPSFLPIITEIVTAQANRDAERTEFAALFGKAKGLLGAK
jgi:Ca-activated chloride channel homolog